METKYCRLTDKALKPQYVNRSAIDMVMLLSTYNNLYMLPYKQSVVLCDPKKYVCQGQRFSSIYLCSVQNHL